MSAAAAPPAGQNPNTATTAVAGTVPVPEEWQRLGFTGLFHLEASVDEDVDLDELAARLPARLPFGSNSSWLGLAVDRERRTVTVVRTDAAAVCDLVFSGGGRRG